MASKNNKKGLRKNLFWGILILTAINILAYQFYIQFDLTLDKRYTLNDKTKSLLKKLDEPVSVKVFLSGEELPADYKRLANSTETLLRTFRDISGNKIEYTFIDPTLADSSQLRMMQDLGITMLPVTVSKGKKGTKQIPVAPYLLVESSRYHVPVALQQMSSARLTAADIQKAEILLEYNIANAIRQTTRSGIDTILYLVGNGQTDGYEVFRMANQLSRGYQFIVDTLQRLTHIPHNFKAAVINKPRNAFSDSDKYKLDQYLMNGGNLLMNLDMTTASFDSFKVSSAFTAVAMDLNINDLLFNYGFRVNPDVVSDLDKSVDIPLQNENTPQGSDALYPFRYFPIFEPASEHPIVKNLNEVLGKFASSIDFVNDAPGVKKTALLQTSKYSRTESVPKLFELTDVLIEPMRSQYDKQHIITGALAEGLFTSLFAQRLPPESASAGHNIKKQSEVPAKLVVFSDGDIFENELSEKYGPMEMGAYMFSPYVFNNSSLLSNVMEYMTDSNHLLDARSKYYESSLLDRKRILDESGTWQAVNIGIPAVLVILFGIIFTFIRKQKYTK